MRSISKLLNIKFIPAYLSMVVYIGNILEIIFGWAYCRWLAFFTDTGIILTVEESCSKNGKLREHEGPYSLLLRLCLATTPRYPRGVVRRLFKSRHNMLEERNVRVTVPSESFYGRGEKTRINVKNLNLRKWIKN